MWYCWCFRNPVNSPVEGGWSLKSTIIYRVLNIARWLFWISSMRWLRFLGINSGGSSICAVWQAGGKQQHQLQTTHAGKPPYPANPMGGQNRPPQFHLNPPQHIQNSLKLTQKESSKIIQNLGWRVTGFLLFFTSHFTCSVAHPGWSSLQNFTKDRHKWVDSIDCFP